MSHTGSGCGRKRRSNEVSSSGVESGQDRKKGGVLNDDLDIKPDVESRKQSRAFRRAWKYKVPDDMLVDRISNDSLDKCTYVSGRTQLACTNVRHKSELDSRGFCEVHTRFFRQLKELYIAEQRRSDPGFFIAKTLDEDGSLLVSDDDETLSTPSEWPASCEDLYGGCNESDDCHPLQRSSVLSEEECLLIKLTLLERKKRALETYRDLLVEKARRRAVFYKKKMTEEAKKGGVIATNRKEQALMQSYRALKNYRHWMFSTFSQYMKRKSDLRLKLNADSSDKFAYLRLTDSNGVMKRCAFFNCQMTDNKSEISAVNHSAPQFLSGKQCLEPVLPGSLYCLKHIVEDKQQKLFSTCSSCSAIITDINEMLCSEKGIKVRVGKDCAFCSKLQAATDDSASVTSSYESSLVEENQVKPVLPGLQTVKELSKGQSSASAVVEPPESTVFGNEKTNRKRRFDDGDGLDGNVKYVVIASSDEDGEEVFKLPGEPAASRPRFVPGIAPQFSTRNRPFNEPKISPEGNIKVMAEHASPTASSSLSFQRRLRMRMKDTCTCARVRPFQRNCFEKEEKKRKTNIQTVIGVSGRYYTSGFSENQKKSAKASMSSIRPSSSAVQTALVHHHIRSAAPKKLQGSLRILHSPTPGLVPQRINAGPGRASISANSNLQPPKLARVTLTGQRTIQSPSYGLLMDPSMISLGPSSSGEASSHTAKSYVAHSVTRPEMQQNSAEVLLPTSGNLQQTYVRSVSTSSADEGRRFAFKSYGNVPRIMPGYRSHASIIVNSSNSSSLPTFRSIPQNQYTERTVTAERQNSSEQYYRRTERAFATGQGIRSRLAFMKSSRNPYHPASYSPYQGNSITSRMREVPRAELRHFSRYETYVDPFTTDSRISRNAIDSEAAAAVASIVNERGDVDDVETLEANDKTECDFGSMKSPARELTYSSEDGVKDTFSDSLQDKKGVDMPHEGPSTDVNTCDTSESTSRDELKCDDMDKMSPKMNAQDRHEDGLAVLALAAESHAAVRSRNAVVASLAEAPEAIPAAQGEVEVDLINAKKKSEQTSAEEEHRNCAPYKIMGFEEEDEDDF